MNLIQMLTGNKKYKLVPLWSLVASRPGISAGQVILCFVPKLLNHDSVNNFLFFY